MFDKPIKLNLPSGTGQSSGGGTTTPGPIIPDVSNPMPAPDATPTPTPSLWASPVTYLFLAAAALLVYVLWTTRKQR